MGLFPAKTVRSYLILALPVEEIEKNEFNLNLPRYIDRQVAEDLQGIEGHLRGGIPVRNVKLFPQPAEANAFLQRL